jgi:hypothetical protein
MDKLDISGNDYKRRIRKALIYFILISLFLPTNVVDDYIPMVFFIFYPFMELIVHPWIFEFTSNLMDMIGQVWFLLFYLSVLAGPILALTNIRIIMSGAKKWVWFNRILIPIFVINLFDNGREISGGGTELGFGYWGYVVVIFIGGVIEIYLYLREKNEKMH